MRFASPAARCLSLLVVAVGHFSLVHAEEPLRWKFKVGEQLDYKMTQKMDMDMDAGQAGKLHTSMNQTMDMQWDVKGVNDKGEAVVEQSIKRIQMKMEAPGGQGFEYDSSSEGPAVGMAAMIAPMFEAMTAGAFEVTMTPRGEVKDVRIPPEMAKAITQGPGGAGGEEAAVEQFKTMVTQGAFVLPENPPTPGQEWTTKVDVKNPAGGNQTVETTYKYEGSRDVDGTTYAVIRPSMKMDLAGNAMMKMTVKEQKTSGEVLFNEAAGRLHSMSIDQDLTMDIGVGGQTMPGTIKQKVDVTVTPHAAAK
jgi:hypothetical protein